MAGGPARQKLEWRLLETHLSVFLNSKIRNLKSHIETSKTRIFSRVIVQPYRTTTGPKSAIDTSLSIQNPWPRPVG